MRGMKVGVLTGTGTYALDEGGAPPEHVSTPYGHALVSRGEGPAGVEVLHISRHEEGHRRGSPPNADPGDNPAPEEVGAAGGGGGGGCGGVGPAAAPGAAVVVAHPPSLPHPP